MSEQTKPRPDVTLTCPACGLVIGERWEAELVFHAAGGDETVTYCQCNRCSHLWITRGGVSNGLA